MDRLNVGDKFTYRETDYIITEVADDTNYVNSAMLTKSFTVGQWEYFYKYKSEHGKEDWMAHGCSMMKGMTNVRREIINNYNIW